jgi:membrane associated rhomboid family serine protease
MPPVTTALIVANVAIYFLQQVMPGLVGPFALWPLAAGAMSGGHVSFQPWQVVTYAFLHGGITHLLFNMFALYMFGSAMEQVVGPKRYLNFYLVCVITAAAAQLATSSLFGGVYPTVGASGGVFGLLLAYAVYFPRNRVMLLFPPIPLPARTFVILYAILELVLGVTGSQEGVAHFAHLGGLVGGALMIWYWRRG